MSVTPRIRLTSAVGDYIGRTYLPYGRLLPKSHRRILAFSLARLSFVPLFLMCHLSSHPGSAWIRSDTIYFLILLGFGATNGWLGAISIITASTPGLNPELQEDEREIAATLGAFCLVAGLAVGSAGSFGVGTLVS